MEDLIELRAPAFGDAIEALGDFRCFPTWMWRNRVMVDFVQWLRAHNDTAPEWELAEFGANRREFADFRDRS